MALLLRVLARRVAWMVAMLLGVWGWGLALEPNGHFSMYL